MVVEDVVDVDWVVAEQVLAASVYFGRVAFG